MNRNFMRGIAILMAVICLGFSILFFVKAKVAETEYQNGDAAYDLLIAQVIENNENKASEEIPEPLFLPEICFEALQEINEELGTWLYLPDSVIDYPVAHGTDNQYYLTHLADGTENANGCIFIDYRNHADFSDRNTLIYGHHMKNGKMFADLVSYTSQTFYEQHPVMYLSVEEKNYRLEVFSGYTTSVDSSAYRMSFSDDTDYCSWLKEIAGKSDFQTAMNLNKEDRIVTLSTCAYSFENARYVVHGRLVEME